MQAQYHAHDQPTYRYVAWHMLILNRHIYKMRQQFLTCDSVPEPPSTPVAKRLLFVGGQTDAPLTVRVANRARS